MGGAMKIMTQHFGEIEYQEADVIVFEQGLPGIFDVNQFILLFDEEDDTYCWMQCVEDGDLAFVLMDVPKILPDYAPRIAPTQLTGLGEDYKIYNIAIIPEEPRDMRVNLKAPIVINPHTQKGKQVIADNPEYSVRHYLFEDVENSIGR
jgi:flagellar assembly factor FliW